VTQVAEMRTAARHAELYRCAVVAQLLGRLSDEERSAPWLAKHPIWSAGHHGMPQIRR